jgi:mannose-1-phosphate guanylyltransferase
VKDMERVETRWGYYNNVLELFRGEKHCKVKTLYLNPNENISYQYHAKRGENWVISQGSGTFVKDGVFYEVSQGMSVHIPIGSKHAIKAGDEGIEIVEVQFGDECVEEDIVRLHYHWFDILRFAGVDE